MKGYQPFFSFLIIVGAALWSRSALAQETPTTIGAQSAPDEIAVSAEASGPLAPDTVRMAVRIEATGKNATEAQAALEKKRDQVTKALKQASSGASSIMPAALSLSGAAGDNTPVTPATAVKMRSTLQVQSSNLALTSALVDAALGAGAAAVEEISYVVSDGAAAQEQLLAAAAQQARAKAESLARALDVSLGTLLSATVIEEPEGALVRLRNLQGTDATGVPQARILLSVRYGVRPNS